MCATVSIAKWSEWLFNCVHEFSSSTTRTNGVVETNYLVLAATLPKFGFDERFFVTGCTPTAWNITEIALPLTINCPVVKSTDT